MHAGIPAWIREKPGHRPDPLPRGRTCAINLWAGLGVWVRDQVAYALVELETAQPWMLGGRGEQEYSLTNFPRTKPSERYGSLCQRCQQISFFTS